jgi:ankyrin repeat protein
LKEFFDMKRKLRMAATSLAALFIVILLANYNYIREERARQFTAAAWDGNLTKMRILLWLGADVKEDVPGMAPAIVSAAWNGHTKIVEYLLEHGADINAQAKINNTPIKEAASNGHLETVRLLISKGANVNIVGDGGSALHIAVEKGYTDIAELLRRHGAKDCREHQFNRCA